VGEVAPPQAAKNANGARAAMSQPRPKFIIKFIAH
jgi:hypothetical protein